MTGDPPLAQCFPHHLTQIASRRAQDPAFHEICSDFEDLHQRVPNLAKAHGDTLHTLQALQDEIKTYLGIPLDESGDP